MAFICEKCCEKIDCFFIPVSYGQCEDCGTVSSCRDIPTQEINKIASEKRGQA